MAKLQWLAKISGKHSKKKVGVIVAIVLIVVLLLALVGTSVLAYYKPDSAPGFSRWLVRVFVPGRFDVVQGTYEYNPYLLLHFDGLGNGYSIVDSNKNIVYKLSYTLDDEHLFIDYETEAKKDIDYFYEFQGKQLILFSEKEPAFALTRK